MRMIFSLPNGIFFVNLHIKKLPMTKEIELHSCADLIDYVSSTGFLPLLDSGIRGHQMPYPSERPRRWSPEPYQSLHF